MTADEIESYVDAAAAALNLPLAPAHRPGVVGYFTLAATMAQVLDEVALDPGDEPAEAFTPVVPRHAPRP